MRSCNDGLIQKKYMCSNYNMVEVLPGVIITSILMLHIWS